MSKDVLAIQDFSWCLSDKAIEYLKEAVPEKHRIGVADFVNAQSKLFNQYASDLASVFMAIKQAPKSLDLEVFEFEFVEWLRECGVSSSRITQLKGAIRIKQRVLSADSHYNSFEKEIISNLEFEKAYLLGRLTWEGQGKAFNLHRDNGRISLQDLRQLVKTYQYDPKAGWKERSNMTGPTTSQSQLVHSTSTKALPLKAYDLVVTLQSVVDELLDIQPQWDGDQRVLEVVDPQRLTILTNQLCAGRDLGWDF